jgi:hypothetical protein
MLMGGVQERRFVQLGLDSLEWVETPLSFEVQLH